jgi:predicted RNase H-like HicB family nuclease
MKTDPRRRWKGKYLATDGKLVIWLHIADEGGYIVTAPFDSRVVTQAESLEEAFEMAYDVIETFNKLDRDNQRAAKRDKRSK